MEQLHSVEDNVPSARQEITRSLYNPKFHYPLHKCWPLAPGQNHINRLSAFTGRFLTQEGVSNENIKSAIKIRNTALLSCKLTTMILMV